MNTEKQELWCVHLQGPDTIIPQPDHESAVKRAAEMNATIERVWATVKPSEFNPLKPVASVIPYTGTAEHHAAGVAEHGGNPEDWF